MHRKQVRDGVGRTVMASQPGPQQAADIVRELRSRVALHLADALLQQRPHHRIGAWNATLQVTGRKDRAALS